MKRNEHTTVILVHSNELHPISPKPRWNPLNKHTKHTYTTNVLEPYKNLDTLAEKHYFSTHSSRNPINKSLQSHFYKEWNMKRIHLIEDAEIYLRPVEQIAYTVAAPLTKPWSQPRTSTLLICKIFQEHMLILCKSLILCCKTCFLNCMIHF